MHQVFVGIDPGVSGAIAVLDPEDHSLDIADMPVFEVKSGKRVKREVDPVGVAAVLRPLNIKEVLLEKVGAMPGQGVTSMFGFGRSYGVVQGVLAGLMAPVTLINPATWKKALGLLVGKDAARKRASELMPSHAHLWQLKKHDGRAEAQRAHRTEVGR